VLAARQDTMRAGRGEMQETVMVGFTPGTVLVPRTCASSRAFAQALLDHADALSEPLSANARQRRRA